MNWKPLSGKLIINADTSSLGIIPYDSYKTDVTIFTTEVSAVNHSGRVRHRFYYGFQRNRFRNFLGNSDHCPFLTFKFSRKIQKRKKGELWIETCDSKSLLTLTNLTSTVRLIRESRIHNNRRF